MMMEPKEELLAEQYRPMYRTLRKMGLSESAAFMGAVGRDGSGSVYDGTGLDVDRRLARYMRLGLSEEGAKAAVAGRGGRSYDDLRRQEIQESQQRPMGGGKVRRHTDSLTVEERRRIIRGEPITEVLSTPKQAPAPTGPTRKSTASARIQQLIETEMAPIMAPIMARIEILEARQRASKRNRWGGS